ncbi:MAG: cytochrome c-type biogenesis protein CcmH [Granulosicoccus sp.]
MSRSVWARVLGMAFLLAFSVAQAVEVVGDFDNPEQTVLYNDLLKEYRCLKCQNQNLSDSNASLAGDLRREIRDQVLAGKGKQDIDEYLVARYGEFVLYRPRFNSKTLVLWLGPFVLLLIGLTSLFIMIRKRSGAGAQPVRSMSVSKSEEENQSRLEKARHVLKD